MPDPVRTLYRNASYDGQLVRTLAAATAGGADLGEAFATARGIRRLTGDAWYAAWSAAAARAEEAAGRGGDREGSRLAYLRASEYHRQSFYFLRRDLDDPRLQDAYARHVETFGCALDLLRTPAAAVRIPYEGTTLHGYLFAPDDRPRPTLVFPCGYDSTAEAGWGNVPPALARGYAVLLVEGPGQGEALYRRRLFLRPDFEAVCGPVLEWLLGRPEVDPGRVALVGRSFGGYLAPRAAAYDHRLAALVCDPAQPDMGARLPAGPLATVAAPAAALQRRLSPARAEFFGARMAAHGIGTVAEYFAELRRFTMLDRAADIRCPTLIVEAERDFAGGSGQLLADAMTAPVEVVRLSARDGGSGHCAGLAQQVWADAVYPWLNRVLAPTAAPVATGRDTR